MSEKEYEAQLFKNLPEGVRIVVEDKEEDTSCLRVEPKVVVPPKPKVEAKKSPVSSVFLSQAVSRDFAEGWTED